MCSPLVGVRRPLRILEVGAGTGSVTDEILRRLQPGDSLTICELHAPFLDVLKQRIAGRPEYIQHSSQITFFEGPVQNLPEGEPYDAIICSLPFLNFDKALVKEILAKIKRLSGPASVMTYYEYCFLRRVSRRISPEKRRRRIQELDLMFRAIHRQCNADRHRVWLNILPINVYSVPLDNLELSLYE